MSVWTEFGVSDDQRRYLEGVFATASVIYAAANNIGNYLILLDTGCNIQVSNQLQLFENIKPIKVNDLSSARTLGGAFTATHRGHGNVVGDALFDKSCGLAALRYKDLDGLMSAARILFTQVNASSKLPNVGKARMYVSLSSLWILSASSRSL